MRPDHGQDPNVWEASTANILMFSELVNCCSEKATQLFDTWNQGSELDNFQQELSQANTSNT